MGKTLIGHGGMSNDESYSYYPLYFFCSLRRAVSPFRAPRQFSGFSSGNRTYARFEIKEEILCVLNCRSFTIEIGGHETVKLYIGSTNYSKPVDKKLLLALELGLRISNVPKPRAACVSSLQKALFHFETRNEGNHYGRVEKVGAPCQ